MMCHVSLVAASSAAFRVCISSGSLSARCDDEGWVLGVGSRSGRALLNWSGYPERDRCSGELPVTAGGKVDMAGGVWEAEPGVLADAVGVGRGGQGDVQG